MLRRTLPFIRRLREGVSGCRSYSISHIPSASITPVIELPETKVTTLQSGFRVASYDTGIPTATVGVWIDGGSRYENDHNNGVAHFLEHMAFKGTTKRTQMGLELEVENMGAHLNAYTSRENIVYYAKCFDYDLERGVEILSDILLNSVYAKGQVERERGVILREMMEVNQNMQEVVFDELHAGAFKGTPLARTILGPVENIETLKREDMIEYVSRTFKGPRMVLVATGGVNHKRLVEFAERHFGKVGHGGDDVLEFEKGVFSSHHQTINNTEMELLYGAVTVEGTSWSHEDNLTMQVAHTMMGQYDRSVGLGITPPTPMAKSADSIDGVESFLSFATNYKDTGLAGVYFVSRPEAGKDVAELICKEWKRLASGDFTDDSFDRAKRTLYTNILLMLDGTTPVFEDIGRQLLFYNRRIPETELKSMVDAINPQALREVCQKYYTNKPVAFTVVGPTELWPNADYFSKALR